MARAAPCPSVGAARNGKKLGVAVRRLMVSAIGRPAATRRRCRPGAGSRDTRRLPWRIGPLRGCSRRSPRAPVPRPRNRGGPPLRDAQNARAASATAASSAARPACPADCCPWCSIGLPTRSPPTSRGTWHRKPRFPATGGPRRRQRKRAPNGRFFAIAPPRRSAVTTMPASNSRTERAGEKSAPRKPSRNLPSNGNSGRQARALFPPLLDQHAEVGAGPFAEAVVLVDPLDRDHQQNGAGRPPPTRRAAARRRDHGRWFHWRREHASTRASRRRRPRRKSRPAPSRGAPGDWLPGRRQRWRVVWDASVPTSGRHNVRSQRQESSDEFSWLSLRVRQQRRHQQDRQASQRGLWSTVPQGQQQVDARTTINAE